MKPRATEIEQILQQCLDSILSGRETLERALAEYPEQANELRPRLEAALWLKTQRSRLDARPGYVRASRQRLVSRIREGQVHQATQTIWERLANAGRSLFANQMAYRLALVIVVLVTLAGGASGVGMAAQAALPGDRLYSVKLSLENARLAVTLDEVQTASLHIEYAKRRSAEIQTLALEGRLSDIAVTVSRFESHVQRAVLSLKTVAGLDRARAKQLAFAMQETLSSQNLLLNSLTKAAPAGTRAEIERALEIVGAGLVAMQAVAGQAGVDLELTSTVTPTPTIPASNTPNPTRSELTDGPVPSASPTEYPLSSQAPVGISTTPPATQSVPVITTAPTGTAQSPAAIKSTSTATPTIKPQKTKPSPVVKTKKPPPEPTRRPPKPTK